MTVAAASSASTPAAGHPSELCGYTVDSALTSTQAAEPDYLGPSYLAIGPGGRGIVLKPLDGECLHKNGLHPSIRERLGRVRELALAGVANLYGVERERRDADKPATNGEKSANGETPWLIWEYVAGRPLHEYAADSHCTQRKLALAARELVLMVESLHRQGIVHGALRGSNVIVDAHGNVRLTHVSPLLYTDPADDLYGVLDTLRAVLASRQEEKTPLGRLIEEFHEQYESHEGPALAGDALLRQLASRIGTIIEVRDRTELSPHAADDEVDDVPRRRSLLGAMVLLLLAGGIGYGVWWTLRQPANPLPGWIESGKAVVRKWAE